jgi:8-oxo-dGTP diphosphatase
MELEAGAASVALIDEDRVLLIQRAREPYGGLWTLPGGRREAGETPAQCAAREVQEELGLAIGDLVSVQTSSIGPTWVLAVFATTMFAGEIAPSDEVADHRWLTREDARELPTTPGLGATLDRAFHLIQQMQAQQ